MLFLPLAEEIRGNRLTDTIVQLNASRGVYAFVRPQRKPDRLLDVRLQQIAGQVIYRVAHPRVRVKVLFLPGPLCVVRRRATPLQRKKTWYWCNWVRNQQIADVAQLLASKDSVGLRKLGFSENDMNAVEDRETPRCGCGRIASTRAALHAMLPDWAVQSMTNGDCAGRQRG